VDAVTVHRPLAKTETPPKDPTQTQPENFQMTLLYSKTGERESVVVEVLDTARIWEGADDSSFIRETIYFALYKNNSRTALLVKKRF
jgi:hypothetical protein